MKIMIEKGKLRVKYYSEEWEKLSRFYEENGMDKIRSDNLFARGCSGEFYRIRNSSKEFRRKVGDLETTDDINSPLFILERGRALFNVAMFRVIPGRNLVTEITIGDVFIPKEFLKSLAMIFKEYLKYVIATNITVKYAFDIDWGDITPKEATGDET